jgi:excinuclease ABC subunit B
MITGSMQRAIDETNRRRAKQEAYNEKHHITPQSVRKAIRDVLESKKVGEEKATYQTTATKNPETIPIEQLDSLVREIEGEMKQAAKVLDFERAALLRDEMTRLRRLLPAGMRK